MDAGFRFLEMCSKFQRFRIDNRRPVQNETLFFNRLDPASSSSLVEPIVMLRRVGIGNSGWGILIKTYLVSVPARAVYFILLCKRLLN